MIKILLRFILKQEYRWFIPILFDFTSFKEFINHWSNIYIAHCSINDFSFSNIEFPWSLVHFDRNYRWIIVCTKIMLSEPFYQPSDQNTLNSRICKYQTGHQRRYT